MSDTDQWQVVKELVFAVGGTDEALRRTISELGPAAVAALLADEIQVRCDAPKDVSDVALNLSMHFAQESFQYVVTFKDDQMNIEAGSSQLVLAEVRYELSDLARLLYPPRPGYESTSRDVRVVTWPWTGHGGDFSAIWPDKIVSRGEIGPEQRTALGMSRMSLLFRAVQAVVEACSATPRSLDHFAAHYGSDKWGALHWYTPHYERHFSDLRDQPVTVLEIGIGGYNFESLGGESIQMWQRFFPRGLIYGMDIFAKPNVRGPRIHTIEGDQNDVEFLRELGEKYGPFDIVIDDGSHVNEHVRTSYQALFPFVRPGGYYVIEDLHTAYWPEFGGDVPNGSAPTSIALLKDLIDELHRCEFEDPDNFEPPAGQQPSDFAIYHNVAILHKGIAHERGIPSWIQQRADQWLNPTGTGK